MAKAEKPESGNKTASQTSNGTPEKPAQAVSSSAQSRASTKKAAAKPKAADKSPAKASSASAAARTASKAASKPAVPDPASQTSNAALPKPVQPAAAAKPETAGKPSTAPEQAATDAKKPEKPTDQPTATPGAPPVALRRMFWPLVLGGVAAGVIGFAVSQVNLFGLQGDTDDLRATLARQQAAIEALEASEPVAAPQVDPSLLNKVETDLAALAGDVSGLAQTVEQLGNRIATIEARPVVDGADPDAAAAYAAELADLKSSVEAQRSEMESLLSNAKSVEEATADAARVAAGQSALARISAAISNGSSFAGEIDALMAAGIADVPDVLTASAINGIATLANLQARFPDVARAVLADARAAGSDGSESGLGGFLRRQLGARSVTPREGSDPDAILSRADAAVRNGRLDNALQEMNALPQDTLEAARIWMSDAGSHVAAQTAVQSLSRRLATN